jgi:class 3 adenylate cyclase
MISLECQAFEPSQKSVHEQQPRRRSLRAVLVANIVGIGDQASASQNGAAVKAHNEVLLTIVNQLLAHDGWLFGVRGYQLFALFDSAASSVRCALEMQKQLHLSGPCEDIRLRIGVHMGEVHFENELPSGEALAVAAHLESLADAGGILVSSLVMDLVSTQISAMFEERHAPQLKKVLKRFTAFAVPPKERAKTDPRLVLNTTRDRTTELHCQTTHSGSDHLMATRTTNSGTRDPVEATVPIERNIADQEAAAVDVPPPGEKETNRLANGQVNRQIQPDSSADAFDAHVAVQPRQDDGELEAREALERQPRRKTTQSAEPSVVSKTETQSNLLDDQRPSHQCIESLIGALTVHLGPISKVIVGQSLKNASSVEHLIALMEKHIPNNERRFLFHVRASHICATFPVIRARTDVRGI